MTRSRSLLGHALALIGIGIALSLLRAIAFAEPALFRPSTVLSVLREQKPLFAWTPRQLADDDDVIVVDCRTAQEHAVLHPTGAIHMPSQEREKALVELWPRLRGRRVAVLAGASDIALARDVAAYLARHAGVAVTGTVRGGFEAWRDAGLPCAHGGS